MVFIERIFGVSPDGGSGSFEFLLLLGTLVVLVSAVRRVFRIDFRIA